MAFVRAPFALGYRGELEPPVVMQDYLPFGGDEGSWRQAGAEMAPELARLLHGREPAGAEGERVEEPGAEPAPLGEKAAAPGRRGRGKKAGRSRVE